MKSRSELHEAFDQMRGKTAFGHPIGLFVLFLTEMWERFCHYGMRSLFVLYLTQQLLLPGHAENVIGLAGVHGALEDVFGPMTVQALSSQLYGLYTSFAYLTPLLGGWLADRVLGQRRTVLIGAGLMAAGQFLLMSETMFLPAILLLIFGNGCFKPNISTQVGTLYQPGDQKRDSAFSIFYVGINLGALIAPLICGTLGELYGWRYGFAAAGCGMLVSIAIFLAGQRHLPQDTFTRNRATPTGTVPMPHGDRRAILALLSIATLNAAFWSCYEQHGNTFVLWTRDYTDRGIGRWEIPVTWFQSLTPLLVLSLTPVVIAAWAWLRRNGREPGTVVKMSIGCMLCALAYALLAVLALDIESQTKVGWQWSVAFSMLLVLGELHVSPTSLSLVTRVAPARYLSLMMGVNFLSHFVANYLQGFVGTYWDHLPKTTFWLSIAGISSAAGLVILSFYRPLNRMISERINAGCL